MRLRLLAVAAAVAASVLAVPAHAVEWVEERAYVPTKHGEMFVDFVRPKTGKAPVILSITPYRFLYADADPTANRTDFYRTRYTKQGYARAYADLIGTGQSGGCWDYGGKAEAESGAAVVEWLGKQPWSNGKVGMIGTSYDGAIQLEIATLAPKHLAAIVPQEPVSSWYDYNYDHAVTQNATDEEDDPSNTGYPVGTPDLFDLVLGTTPNLDPEHVSAAAAQQQARDAATGCDVVEHETRGHYAQPEYGAFWKERDWPLRAGNVKAAVLFQHGWGDTNTKPNQFTRYWDRLRKPADKRAIVGQWAHTDIFSSRPAGVPFPVDPLEYLDAFFARYLKGSKSKALDRMPKVMSQANDEKFRSTLPTLARQTAYKLGTGSFVNTGTETSKNFKSDPSGGPNFASFAFPVKKDTRLAGSGSVTLRMTSSLPRGQVAVTLLDQGPEATAATVITLGLLDLRFRDSLGVAKDVPTDKAFTATVTLRPQDYVVKKGHTLVLAVAGSDVVWGVPDPVVGQQLAVLAGSTLRLPVGSAGSVLG
ncbi:MAG TPA: CocE/NonD family hydrolase [Frankiaceae bacterium]|nr:CocE/NonD family hydrolase [Frankiaceae bacterium]